MDPIRLVINGRAVTVRDVPPTTTLLRYLRDHRHLVGTKEGCAEGDCGACTVAVLDRDVDGAPAWRAINSCLVPLPSLHGAELVTVEGLGADEPHLVQTTLTEHLGSQCGYCTPGVIMSMFEASYRRDMDAPWKLDDQLCGNLCRCTGYRPIREATEAVAGVCPAGKFQDALRREEGEDAREAVTYSAQGQRAVVARQLQHVLDVLDETPDARLVAGATDLGLYITKRDARFPCMVTVDGVSELQGIEDRGDHWSIGAAVRLSVLEDWADQNLVTLARMLRFFGSRQIKNRATLGGNICNASPIGDTPPVLLSLDAVMVVVSRSGERRIPVDSFFLSYRETALQPGELLMRIEIPKPVVGAKLGSYKVSKRREMDISSVAASMVVTLDASGVVTSARFAYGGMAATPARALAAESTVVGAVWDAATVREAMGQLASDFTPMSDHRGSAWYRAKVAENLLWGFFLETRDEDSVRLPDHPSSTVVLEVGS